MGEVNRLLPGVTTITAHARWYSLHATVAAMAQRQGLDDEETRLRLRRCEVTLTGISLAHAKRAAAAGTASPHAGWATPHGGGKVGRHLGGDEGAAGPSGLSAGYVDVAWASGKKRYSDSAWGFLEPYRGSEQTLGLVLSAGKRPVPGPRADEAALDQAFEGLWDLAAKDRLDWGDLVDHEHLCMCRCAGAADGMVVRSAMFPATRAPGSPDDRRTQSMRLLLRAVELGQEIYAPPPASTGDNAAGPGGDVSDDDDEELGWPWTEAGAGIYWAQGGGWAWSPRTRLEAVIAFSEQAREDPACMGLDAFPAWAGVTTRSISVAAWRDLWSWMVKQIEDFMPVARLGDLLAEQLPDSTLGAFIDGLPPVWDVSGAPVGAELDPTVTALEGPARWLALILLGGQRTRPDGTGLSGTAATGTAVTKGSTGSAGAQFAARAAVYFEHPEERRTEDQLSPTWVAARTHEWRHRPLRDFAVFLAEVLVARAQRIALRKAQFSRTSGLLTVPSRIFVRDGYVYKDSPEGGGGLSLRFDNTLQVLGGMGLVSWQHADHPGGIAGWSVTEVGRAAIAGEALR